MPACSWTYAAQYSAWHSTQEMTRLAQKNMNLFHLLNSHQKPGEVLCKIWLMSSAVCTCQTCWEHIPQSHWRDCCWHAGLDPKMFRADRTQPYRTPHDNILLLMVCHQNMPAAFPDPAHYRSRLRQRDCSDLTYDCSSRHIFNPLSTYSCHSRGSSHSMDCNDTAQAAPVCMQALCEWPQPCNPQGNSHLAVW